MKKFWCFAVLLICSCLALPVLAQTYAIKLWKEIQEFKSQDERFPPQAGSIVFVGSSSIRLWKNLDESFPQHRVLNRGFGGSSLPDLKMYLPDIVYPYQPKQIIIYSGENDMVKGIKAAELLRRFEEVFTAIRQEMPLVPIAYISMKPSPSREKFTPRIAEANALVKNYLKQQPNTQYIDVFTPMLDASGKSRPELFLQDKLHLNASGYQLWQKIVEPHLLID